MSRQGNWDSMRRSEHELVADSEGKCGNLKNIIHNTNLPRGKRGMNPEFNLNLGDNYSDQV